MLQDLRDPSGFYKHKPTVITIIPIFEIILPQYGCYMLCCQYYGISEENEKLLLHLSQLLLMR